MLYTNEKNVCSTWRVEKNDVYTSSTCFGAGLEHPDLRRKVMPSPNSTGRPPS